MAFNLIGRYVIILLNGLILFKKKQTKQQYKLFKGLLYKDLKQLNTILIIVVKLKDRKCTRIVLVVFLSYLTVIKVKKKDNDKNIFTHFYIYLIF